MKLTKKTAGTLMAGLMLASALAPVSSALAVEPSADGQTGTGVTNVTIQLKYADQEFGGTEDPANPDTTPADGFGDNIAFTVPSAINFVAAADGTLTGPSAEACYIENESAFTIHASAFRTETQNGWTITDKDATEWGNNSIDFQWGPAADKLDAYDYTTKADVHDASQWNMGVKVDGAAVTDRVQMNTSGKIHNATQNITEKTSVAKIHTYVKAGTAVAQP
jgi:hypothetical protein